MSLYKEDKDSLLNINRDLSASCQANKLEITTLNSHLSQQEIDEQKNMVC